MRPKCIHCKCADQVAQNYLPTIFTCAAGDSNLKLNQGDAVINKCSEEH